MALGVERPLKQLLELILFNAGLHFQNAVPEVSLFENLDAQVVQVDLQHRNAALGERLDQLALHARHFYALHRIVRAEKKRNLVPKPLLVQEPLARNHGEQVLETLLHGCTFAV